MLAIVGDDGRCWLLFVMMGVDGYQLLLVMMGDVGYCRLCWLLLVMMGDVGYCW